MTFPATLPAPSLAPDPTQGMGMPQEGYPADPTAGFDDELTPELGDLLPEQEDPEGSEYRLDLSEDQKRSLERRIFDYLDAWEQKRSWRLSMAEALRRAHRMNRDQVVRGDEEDESLQWLADTQATDTRRVCDSHATRLNGALQAHSPRFVAEAEEPEAVASLPMQEEVLDRHLDEIRFDEIARLAHDDIVVVSPALIKVCWRTVKRKVPTSTANYDPAKHELLLQQGVNPILAHAASHDLDRKGRIKKKRGWKEITVRDGNELTIIPFEDTILLPPSARCDEDLWGIGEFTSLRGYELKRMADDGKMYEDAVQEVLSSPPGTGSDPNDDQRRQRLELSQMQGGDLTTVFDEEHLHSTYDLVELAFLGDLDEDGEEEWYLLTLEKGRKRLLRALYSSYEHGEAWYVRLPYMDHATEIFGESVAELVALPQEAQTHAVNSHLNLTRLMTQAPFTGLVDPTRMGPDFDPDNFQVILGQILPCATDAVKWLELPQSLPSALAANVTFLQWMKDQIDLLTASSNVVSGKEASGDQTLGEIKAILANAAQVFEDRAVGVMMQWAKVASLCWSNLLQFSQNGEVQFRKKAGPETDEQGNPLATVAGQPMPAPGGVYFGKVGVGDLAPKVTWKPAGLGAFADSQARIQRSVTMLNLTAQDPLWAQNQDARIDLWDQALQDLKVPQREQIIAKLKAGLAQQQAMMQAQLQAQAVQALSEADANAAAADQAEQQGQQGAEAHAAAMDQQAQDAQRAQESHGLAMAQGFQGLQGTEAEQARAQEAHKREMKMPIPKPEAKK